MEQILHHIYSNGVKIKILNSWVFIFRREEYELVDNKLSKGIDIMRGKYTFMQCAYVQGDIINSRPTLLFVETSSCTFRKKGGV